MNTCCLGLLNCGAVCYTAVDNWHTKNGVNFGSLRTEGWVPVLAFASISIESQSQWLTSVHTSYVCLAFIVDWMRHMVHVIFTRKQRLVVPITFCLLLTRHLAEQLKGGKFNWLTAWGQSPPWLECELAASWTKPPVWFWHRGDFSNWEGGSTWARLWVTGLLVTHHGALNGQIRARKETR